MRIRGMRRTVSQISNNSRRRAGFLTARNTKLSSARSRRKGVSGTASRMDMVNANCIQSSRLVRGSYDRLQRAASSLAEDAEILTAKADGSDKKLSSSVEKLAEDFNDTMKALRQNSGVLNNFYLQSLKEAALSGRNGLDSIGILVENDGTLTLNREKFCEADEERVKEVLGSSGDFLKRVKTVAARAADNARVNTESYSSRYTATGGLLAGSSLSRYNFRG